MIFVFPDLGLLVGNHRYHQNFGFFLQRLNIQFAKAEQLNQYVLYQKYPIFL